MIVTNASAPAARTTEPTHGCVRCGQPVPVSVAMCDQCNPLGLREPAASQAHGIAFVGIVVMVVVLAVLGKVALSGIGPFTGNVAGVLGDPPNLTVTLTVTNEGSREGSVTCRVFPKGDAGIGPDSAFLLSPIVGAKETLSFSRAVTTLTTRDLSVDCSS
jgi:predicted nucleic acid-binding Zn ribbon protein